MGTTQYIAIFACLAFAQAIYFNASDFTEEMVCEVGGRPLGVCVDPGHCKARSSLDVDCGIEGAWKICCPSSTDKRLPPPEGVKSRKKCKQFAESLLGPKCAPLRPFNGSNRALPGEFPHMAAVGYKPRVGPSTIRWLCAGSLISELYVLTEHVCANGAKGTGRPRLVRLGDLDLDSKEDDHLAQEIPIKKIHRLWKHKENGVFHNVALLRLARPATLTPAVRPACLYAEHDVPARVGVVLGWGKTSIEYKAPERRILRKADLKLIGRQHCEEVYDVIDTIGYLNEGVLMKNTFLCAGDLTGNRDTCMGDGGAPLVVKLAAPYCTYSVVGVLALGSVPCGQPYKPSVFTRIYHYIPWIEKIVWPKD